MLSLSLLLSNFFLLLFFFLFTRGTHDFSVSTQKKMRDADKMKCHVANCIVGSNSNGIVTVTKCHSSWSVWFYVEEGFF